MVHIIGNPLSGNANGGKLPCVGLRLNASKPESMLESGDMSFPSVIMSKQRPSGPRSYNGDGTVRNKTPSQTLPNNKFKYRERQILCIRLK